MKIVFFGSGGFAVPALKYLIDSDVDEIPAVVTQPDRRSGRGMGFKSTEVKEYVESSGFKGLFFQVGDLGDSGFMEKISGLNPDLFVVACFGQILNKELLAVPKIMAVNIHASLLPKYRGAAPVNWAIINGEKTTGVTIFKMNEELDAGEIISQRSCAIMPEDNSVVLENRLADIGKELLGSFLKTVADKRYSLSPQTGEVSYAPKLKKQDGLIDWNLDASSIFNRIRGLQPWPNAYTYMNSKLLKIYHAEVIDCEYGVPAEIFEVAKDNIKVKCGSKALIIFEVQIEGKRKMTVKEFLSGHKVNTGVKLGT